MKIYVSGKISGVPEAECEKAFADAESALRAAGHDVFNPFELSKVVQHDSYESALRFDIALLLTSVEGIVMLPGWTESRGAVCEFAVAQCIGLQIFEGVEAVA